MCSLTEGMQRTTRAKGATADNENTRAAAKGVGAVVPVTKPVTAAGEANGDPSNLQTVETKLGKETH